MTANVEVIIGAREEALKVPNAALRFRPAGAADETRGGAPAGGPEAARQRTEESVRRLTERLQLTEAQQDGVREVFMEIGQAVRALREQGAPQEQISETVQRLRAGSVQRITALLDDEQRTQYRLLQAERSTGAPQRGRVWTLGADGRPQPVEVVFGISDGSATEIVRGTLQAGERVIVGADAADAR
jgi:HlyD family secretion protein